MSSMGGGMRKKGERRKKAGLSGKRSEGGG